MNVCSLASAEGGRGRLMMGTFPALSQRLIVFAHFMYWRPSFSSRYLYKMPAASSGERFVLIFLFGLRMGASAAEAAQTSLRS